VSLRNWIVGRDGCGSTHLPTGESSRYLCKCDECEAWGYYTEDPDAVTAVDELLARGLLSRGEYEALVSVAASPQGDPICDECWDLRGEVEL